MILGDLGAHVIKVERPGAGDETRGWGPPFDEHGNSAYYLSLNRNKLSIALDLDSPADRGRLVELAGGADVVVDNFRHGTLERRGIDPLAVLGANANAIWCTVTGFGLESRRPGYDFVAQAECGWMAITGEPDGEPLKTGLALADVVAGKDAAIAILAGLAARRPRPASARRVVVSLADSARAALGNAAQNVLMTGRDVERWGNAHGNLVPYQLFHANDRAVVIAVGSDAQWRACALALDLPELANDPSLGTNAGRLAARERVVAAMANAVRSLPAAEIQRRLDAAGIPNGVVKTVLEAVREVNASRATGMPSSVAGEGAPMRAPPRLDEHGRVLKEWGWEAFRLLSV